MTFEFDTIAFTLRFLIFLYLCVSTIKFSEGRGQKGVKGRKVKNEKV